MPAAARAAGKGSLFAGFLSVGKKCEACGLDYAFADAGDGPAIFVILLSGFIVVGAALIVEVRLSAAVLAARGAVGAADPDR